MFCEFLKECSNLCIHSTNAVIILCLWFSRSEGALWLIGQNLILSLETMFSVYSTENQKNASKAVSELLRAVFALGFIMHMSQFEALRRSLIQKL